MKYTYKLQRTYITESTEMTVEADTWLEARVLVQRSINNNYAYKNAKIIRVPISTEIL